MRDLKGIFPGVFTMGNIFCGFLAIISCVRGADPTEPAWLIVLAVFLDILDGRVARLSNSASQFGVQLDSLADMISFGVAPAVMLYSYRFVGFGRWGWILGFIFIMAASFRLARFNVTAELEKKKVFIGLPVPAAAVALAAYVIFSQEVWGEARLEKFAITMVVGFALLMVSSIEYDANPQFSLRNRAGIARLSFFIVSVSAIIYRPSLVLFPVALMYVLSGILREGFLLLRQAHLIPDTQRSGDRGAKTSGKASSTRNKKEKTDDGKSLRFPEGRSGRSSGTDD